MKNMISLIHNFKTANSEILSEDSAVRTMATDSVVDLFSLSVTRVNPRRAASKSRGVEAVQDNLPELWDQTQYNEEYDKVKS